MSTLVRLMVSAVLVVLGTGLGTSPVWAHANVVGSSPAADAQLETAPTEVTVRFDSALMDMGAAMVVRRDDGATVSVGSPTPAGREVSIAVDPQAGPGLYTVAFRVTTEDGHAIESTFAYTVLGEPGQSPVAESAAALPSAAESSGTGAAPTQSMSGAPSMPAVPASSMPDMEMSSMSHEHSGDVPVAAIVTGAAVFVLLAVAGAVVQRRRS